MPTEIEFDAATHTYRVSGEEVIGVTRVLVESGLIDTRFFTELGRARGSAAHQALEFLDQGDLDEESLDPKITGFVAAYQSFKDDSGFEVEQIEQRVFHPTYRFAGTFDRTGKLNAHPIILEFKTTSIPPTTPIQLSAYEACLPDRRRRYAVQLLADGKYRLHEYKDRNDFKIFLAALAVMRWKSNNGVE